MIRILGLLLLGGSALALVAASQPLSAAAEGAQPIRVSQFISNRPIGLLGKPLGERLVIEGTLAERVMLANPIAIVRAGGHALPQVVRIELTGDKAPKLEKNVTYKLEGYESGAFSGPPGWLSPEAQQPFQYRPSFVVTRVIAPVTK